jgi:hypothetical protein
LGKPVKLSQDYCNSYLSNGLVTDHNCRGFAHTNYKYM